MSRKEFEKAREEAVPSDGNTILSPRWVAGANWAYEWCGEKFYKQGWKDCEEERDFKTKDKIIQRLKDGLKEVDIQLRLFHSTKFINYTDNTRKIIKQIEQEVAEMEGGEE